MVVYWRHLLKSHQFMAKFLSNILSKASGSLAGITFSRNKGGGYIRARVTPLNPNTPKQANKRAQFSTAASFWRSLSEVQRATWINAAPSFPYTDTLGQSRIYSGFQLYMKFNNALLAAGEPIIGSAPNPSDFAEVFISSFSSTTTAACTINFTGSWENDEIYIVYATPPLSAGISRPAESLFRQIKLTEGGLGEEEIIAGTEYQDVFGNVGAGSVGQKIFVRVETIAVGSGQKSLIGRASTSIVAA